MSAKERYIERESLQSPPPTGPLGARRRGGVKAVHRSVELSSTAMRRFFAKTLRSMTTDPRSANITDTSALGKYDAFCPPRYLPWPKRRSCMHYLRMNHCFFMITSFGTIYDPIVGEIAFVAV